MLDWDEAKKMADEGTSNPRDAALIAVSYELGPRDEEIMVSVTSRPQ